MGPHLFTKDKISGISSYIAKRMLINLRDDGSCAHQSLGCSLPVQTDVRIVLLHVHSSLLILFSTYRHLIEHTGPYNWHLYSSAVLENVLVLHPVLIIVNLVKMVERIVLYAGSLRVSVCAVVCISFAFVNAFGPTYSFRLSRNEYVISLYLRVYFILSCFDQSLSGRDGFA